MSRVEILEQEIRSLSEADLAAFRAWYAEFDALIQNEPVGQVADESKEHADAPASHRRHISQVIVDNMRDVPAEVLASMPLDGAAEHDHYIYGWPKRGE